jgi:PAS domain S-box-containing protein
MKKRKAEEPDAIENLRKINEMMRSTEERLRDREANLKAILENSLESIWSIDCNYRIQYVNEVFIQSFLSTFGKRLEKGMDIIEVLPEQLQQKWKDLYDRALRNEHFTFTDKIDLGDNSVYIEVAMNPIVINGVVAGASFYGKDITEQKRKEEYLLASETKYRQIFEKANDAILILSNDTIVDCNVKTLEMFECSRSDIIGQQHFKFSPPTQADNKDSSEKAKGKIRKALNGTPQNFEWVHTRLSGDTFDAEVSLSTFLNHRGENMIQAIVRDISYRKAVEKALLRSEANMKTIIENTLENIWSINDRYEIQYLNSAFEYTFNRIFGVELRKGSNILESLPSHLKELWKERFDKALENVRMVFEDKLESPVKTYYAEITMNPIVVGTKVVGASFYARNVTEKRLAEIQMRYQSDLRKLLITLSNSFINLPTSRIGSAINTSLAKIGKFVGADRAYVFDYDYEKRIATNTYEWCRTGINPCIHLLQAVPMNSFMEWIGVHEKGKSVKVDDSRRYPKGNLRDLMESQDILSLLTIPLNLDGKPIGFVGFDSVSHTHKYTDYEEQLLQIYAQMLVNLKERLAKEEKLIEAKEKAEESNRLKTAFLQNMSHEIRTPMNAILGFLTLLKEPDLKGEAKNDYIEVVEQSGQRLLKTINDIIEISKIEAGQTELVYSDVDIAGVLKYHHDLFKPACNKRGLTLEVVAQLPPDMPKIRTDHHKLDGILTNLINNAIKFTQTGGIELSVKKEHNTLIFCVKDTGTGIPANRTVAIFDRFVQADISNTRPYEGSGLGLSIARAYTELLHGRIWVESDVGKGSAFYFTIPYKVDVSEKIIAGTTSFLLMEKPVKGTILIAEDDETSFIFLRSILAADGIKLIRTVNGDETVRMVQENKEISLVLMDIKMPGKNGLDATREIRRFNQDIPILAQTAYALAGDMEKALRAGCNEYITKPINRDKLRSLVHKYIK